MGQFDKLFEPLRIKHLTLRNRIASTGHAEVYAEGGVPTERFIRYHAEKAKGGIGLSICGGSSSVSPDSPSALWGGIDVSDDRVIPHFQKLAGAMHAHGAAIMIQLTHMGRRSSWNVSYYPHLVSPSGLREPLHRHSSKTMEIEDIRRIVKDFGQAARRVKEGGLDGAELSAAHQHLIDQFWSPHTNQRTDAYGGNFANRLRFGLEVLEEIRRVVGADFILAMRMAGDEMIPGGLTQRDLIEIAKFYAGTGLLDFIDVANTGADTPALIANVVPSMAYPPEPWLYLASAIKAEIDLPVLHAGNIKDPAAAARILAEGHVDLVGMTRAHLADPHFVNKLKAGEPDHIRQCVGANNCINRNYLGVPIHCIQNPATGRERTLPHVIAKAPAPKRIVVVGGGPAGMEAARVSAERGHAVTLFEKNAQLGGQITLAAKAPARDQIAGITRWFALELKRLQVDLRLNTTAVADTVRALAPDIVVLATGGTPNLDEFPGWHAAAGLVASSHDILAGKTATADNVLVFDALGQYAGATTADYIANRSALVELVTPDPGMGEDIGGTTRPVYHKRLYEKDVILSPNLFLHEVYREGNRLVAVLKNEYTAQEEERVVDQVVVENGVRPDEALYFELKNESRNHGQLDLAALYAERPQPPVEGAHGFLLYRIGDCVSARDIHAAIYDALRLCKDF
ncbi:MAG: FAD-dependent oxidoreductase [Gammaproteobacteria bacterium]